jgi:hypothetical protein
VFRKRLGLKFKKIKKIPFRGNSEKNLVLRQQFAMKMLELLESGKRVLNIDESWMTSTNFKRSKWREHGTTNSMPEKHMSARVAIIAAVDTEGDVYVSLNQVNTDIPMMKLFISKLAIQLDYDRPQWREDTVFLLDGASYHISDEVQQQLSGLGIPVIFTGPYSYDACPIELLFSQLKSTELNPEGLPTGTK